jgi:hypothetical protein
VVVFTPQVFHSVLKNQVVQLVKSSQYAINFPSALEPHAHTLITVLSEIQHRVLFSLVRHDDRPEKEMLAASLAFKTLHDSKLFPTVLYQYLRNLQHM